jgi:hypothetical protein
MTDDEPCRSEQLQARSGGSYAVSLLAVLVAMTIGCGTLLHEWTEQTAEITVAEALTLQLMAENQELMADNEQLINEHGALILEYEKLNQVAGRFYTAIRIQSLFFTQLRDIMQEAGLDIPKFDPNYKTRVDPQSVAPVPLPPKHLPHVVPIDPSTNKPYTN